jgi:hypothetical protein
MTTQEDWLFQGPGEPQIIFQDRPVTGTLCHRLLCPSCINRRPSNEDKNSDIEDLLVDSKGRFLRKRIKTETLIRRGRLELY